jgi:hypothetical protein
MCLGGAYDDVSDSFYGSWSTANGAIATVNTYGIHTRVAVGSTTSSSHGQLNINDVHLNCPLKGINCLGNDNVNCTLPLLFRHVHGPGQPDRPVLRLGRAKHARNPAIKYTA